jgi:cyclic pyranopterin phosphate synthase
MSRAPERFPEKLVDKFGRTVDYVRISVTDRCDFRCVYCMDEEMEFLPRDRILTLEELELVGKAFAELGVTKIRLTGGEPLVRKDVITLIENLGTIQSLKELVITTNGSQLVKLALPLKNAGVKRINISLDSLNPKKFKELTRTGQLKQVLDGIKAAKAANFEKIKINAVILKNRNDDEVKALVDFSADNDLDISFIEEMPLGVIGEHDRAEAYYSSDNIKADLEKHYTLIPTPETTAGPSKYFRVAETGARIGFISPHSHNFCDDCNRVRLTAEGRLLLCLGQEHSVDLRAVLRTYPGDINKLKSAIVDSMDIKPKGHDFDLSVQPLIFRHMSHTGG